MTLAEPVPHRRDINNAMRVVGRAYVDGTYCHACLWESDATGEQWTIRDLGTLGSAQSSASAINNLGEIVGSLYSPGGAFLCDGVMHDLNDFLPTGSGWQFFSASDINDEGQITGSDRNSQGFHHAFLMDDSVPSYWYTYTSTGKAVSIRDNASASKSITPSDNYSILDLNVAVNLTHGSYADLKIELIGPKPYDTPRVLCNAGDLQGSGSKTLGFDDEEEAGTIKPFQPLSHYDGKTIMGTWTLRVTDTVKNRLTGTLNSWTLTIPATR